MYHISKCYTYIYIYKSKKNMYIYLLFFLDFFHYKRYFIIFRQNR